MGDRVEEAVLLLVAAYFAYQKDRVENDAGDDEAEENHAQNERHDLAPVENDPTDVEHQRRRGQRHAQRNERTQWSVLRLVMRMETR